MTGTGETRGLAHLLKPVPHKPGWFERHAVSFLRERARDRILRRRAREDRPSYVLSEAERDAVQAVVRTTVVRSFLTGALSAAFCLGVFYGLKWQELHWIAPWAGLGAASLVATVFEVCRLYFTHLDAVSEILILTGTKVSAVGAAEDDIDAEVAHALARAALDLPDPKRLFEEIDPERETSRLFLLSAIVLYKGKRSISNFLVKEVLLHVFPTAAVRAVVPLVSIPITGAWNALVSWRVLREARLRAVGPSAVQEICAALLPASGEAPLSDACRLSLLRAVGVTMVREHSAHPNVFALLYHLAPYLGEVKCVALDDSRRFMEGFQALAADERVLVLQLLQISAVCDGSVGRRLRVLIAEARAACGLSSVTTAVDELGRRLLAGEKIEPSVVAALSA